MMLSIDSAAASCLLDYRIVHLSNSRMLLATMPRLPPIPTLLGASRFMSKSGDLDRQLMVVALMEEEGYEAVAEVLMVAKALKDVVGIPRTADAADLYLVDEVETWPQEAVVNLSPHSPSTSGHCGNWKPASTDIVCTTDDLSVRLPWARRLAV